MKKIVKKRKSFKELPENTDYRQMTDDFIQKSRHLAHISPIAINTLKNQNIYHVLNKLYQKLPATVRENNPSLRFFVQNSVLHQFECVWKTTILMYRLISMYNDYDLAYGDELKNSISYEINLLLGLIQKSVTVDAKVRTDKEEDIKTAKRKETKYDVSKSEEKPEILREIVNIINPDAQKVIDLFKNVPDDIISQENRQLLFKAIIQKKEHYDYLADHMNNVAQYYNKIHTMTVPDRLKIADDVINSLLILIHFIHDNDSKSSAINEIVGMLDDLKKDSEAK